MEIEDDNYFSCMKVMKNKTREGTASLNVVLVTQG